jgi:hypothetical protein
VPSYGVLCIDRAHLRGLGAMPAKIGGEEVELLNDSHFEKIRDACGVTISDLTADLFQFSALEKGGGKGGSLMQVRPTSPTPPTPPNPPTLACTAVALALGSSLPASCPPCRIISRSSVTRGGPPPSFGS